MMIQAASIRCSASALPSVGVERVVSARDGVVIDLRSPAEFSEDHIPGAHSVALFEDVQRALVGTLYYKVSPSAAFEEGRGIVRGRIRDLVARIGELSGWSVASEDLEARVLEMTSGGLERLSADLECSTFEGEVQAPVFFNCWRGGLRSRSVVAFVRGLGLDRAFVVEGGYKSWRKNVAHELDAFHAPRAFVLRGLTGVGKTLVLRELERLRPGWTLDLEALAGHRSSLLGMVGLEPCSQKAFESRLVMRIRQGFPGRVVVEGESRKVGDIILHPRLWDSMSDGINIEVTAGVQRRVAVLKEDYLADERNRAELMRQLPLIDLRLVRKHGAPSLCDMLARGDVDALVRLLLERYYDPLYAHSERGKSYAFSVDAAEPARAAREIAHWIESTSPA